MAKVNSKKKGDGFERTIVKDLTMVLGFEFRRSYGSGAYHDSYEQAHELGDVRPKDPEKFTKFPMIIECKFYKEIAYHQILMGHCLRIDTWLTQLEMYKGIRGTDKGILIFKANRRPIMVMTKLKNMPRISESFMIYKGLWVLLPWELYLSKLDEIL